MNFRNCRYTNPVPTRSTKSPPDALEECRSNSGFCPPTFRSYDTIDIVFVIEGEVDLEQSDGVTARLRRGDVVVQNGTMHAWNNPTDARCVLGFVFCGANRTDS